MILDLRKKYKDYYGMVNWCTFGRYILNNEIIEHADDWDLYCGNDYDEFDEPIDIFQWFIIDEQGAESFAEYTDEIVYYSEDLNMFLLAVTHFGTPWDSVPSNWKEADGE